MCLPEHVCCIILFKMCWRVGWICQDSCRMPLVCPSPATAAAHPIRTSEHLPQVCVPFEEICNPALRSVQPHQLDGNCPVVHVGLSSDRRRQRLEELLGSSLTSCQSCPWVCPTGTLLFVPLGLFSLSHLEPSQPAGLTPQP